MLPSVGRVIDVLDPAHGYFADEASFRAPVHNYIFSAYQGGGTDPMSIENAQRVRYGLATASLGEGYGVFGPSDRSVRTAMYHLWWYDEYAVDLASGRSANDLAHTHWLGDALGPEHQMIWAGTNDDAVGNHGFEDDVTSGWSFGLFSPAVALGADRALLQQAVQQRLHGAHLPALGGAQRLRQFLGALRLALPEFLHHARLGLADLPCGREGHAQGGEHQPSRFIISIEGALTQGNFRLPKHLGRLFNRFLDRGGDAHQLAWRACRRSRMRR